MINKFKRTLKKENVSYAVFCEKIGILPGSFWNLLGGKNIPKWIKSFNFGYELGSKTKEIKDIEVVDAEIITLCPKCKLEVHPIMGMICKDVDCPGIKEL